MDTKKYQLICDWFARLNLLEADEQIQQLARLRIHDSSLAESVSAMLLANRAAGEDNFLEHWSNGLCTNTYHSAKNRSASGNLPERIGTYQILEELGRGGMGIVYRAHHAHSDRTVAIKVIQSGGLSTAENIARFRREARSAARLRHPNIVPVFDVSNDGDIDFFTMALIEGESLHAKIKQGPLSSQTAAQLILKVASAVDYAHSKGVIHRDIKPGNLMVDLNGEPMLTDFGLAKITDIDDGQTRTTQLLGTANYMAPEQINDARNVGPGTDVYGLGATLYYCLTARPPILGRDVVDTLHRVREKLPDPPRSIEANIDPDLELICLRCLQKDPRDRYQSAQKLADDLSHYLHGEPLEKSSISWWTSLSRTLRRNDLPNELPSATAASWVAALTLIFHLFVYLIILTGQASWVLWVVMGLWFFGINAINYIYHWSQYWQLAIIERQSGIVQLAVNFSLVTLFLIHGPLTLSQSCDQFLGIYPPLTLIVAVACMAHGIAVGRLILPATLFFPLAVLIAYVPPIWGPLLLGCTGAIIVSWIGYQLRFAAG